MVKKQNQAARETVILAGNERISDSYFRLTADCDSHYLEAAAGQFVTLRMPDQKEPLLRRPFSIHQVLAAETGKPQIEILYRVVGGFTERLSQAGPGSLLDLLGPLGRGFSVKHHHQPVAIVAGGIGVAPLVFLASQLKDAGTDMDQVSVFIGGRSENDILCQNFFKKLGTRAVVATEDGSAGYHGLVTAPLEKWAQNKEASMIYACGPHGMLTAVGKIARSKNIACEVSIETLMACGLGVCMGCAVKTQDKTQGYSHVCKDGPVFDAAVL